MDIVAKIEALADTIEQHCDNIGTEEATKTALVMPFIQSVLGYDLFNPTEVIPEFTADVGIKKGEKVDYAIAKDGQVQMLIECKKIGDSLDASKASQLYRYFGTTSAKIAILTNGRTYKFYTDLESPNRMDERPFLVLDLLRVDGNVIPELEKLTKSAFDLESVMSAAEELKYVSMLKRGLANILKTPDDDFSKMLISMAYDGMVTQKIRDQFSPMITKAIRQFLTDQVNERLKTAIASKPEDEKPEGGSLEDSANQDEEKDAIITTQEEVDGFNIVRAIIRSEVDVQRIFARDTLSYFGILLDDNNRNPICRFHFNRTQKYIELFVGSNKGERFPINELDDIFNFSETLKTRVHKLLE